ncbi:MAG: hypothetical protein WDN31_14835 [Hyphomicrobium sp.]
MPRLNVMRTILSCLALSLLVAGALPSARAETADSMLANQKAREAAAAKKAAEKSDKKLDPNAPVSRPNLACPVSKCVNHRFMRCSRQRGHCRCTPASGRRSC